VELMRVIVCDEETKEPITVIELAYRDLMRWARQGQLDYIRVATQPKFEAAQKADLAMIPRDAFAYIVELRIVRSGDLWVAFTRQGEKALELRAVLLPGQALTVQRAYPWQHITPL
jgi:hypothetical protein